MGNKSDLDGATQMECNWKTELEEPTNTNPATIRVPVHAAVFFTSYKKPHCAWNARSSRTSRWVHSHHMQPIGTPTAKNIRPGTPICVQGTNTKREVRCMQRIARKYSNKDKAGEMYQAKPG